MQTLESADKQTVQDALNALEEWKTTNPGAPLCVACGGYIDFFGSATTPQEILDSIQKEYGFAEPWEAADYILRAELSEFSIH